MSHALAVLHGSFGRAALYNLDRPITLHAHREGHLIFLVEGPSATVRVNDAVVPVAPGSAAAVSPWEPHEFLTGEAGRGALFLVLYLKPVWFLEASRSASFALNFGRPAVEVTRYIQSWVVRLSSLLMAGDPTELFDGYLYELTRDCFDQSWQWAPEASPMRLALGGYLDYRVRKAQSIMRDDFRGAVDMDQIARKSGLSRPHFFKLFKKQMGITPNLYMNTLRTEAAIEDLLRSPLSVTDIGHALGFASQSSFTRFFTYNVGIPPSDYRRVALRALH
ncbi:AraC family transcriptional regulator [Paralimibaculum aggregatum]|uniref:AraC family transcriptional regulator n=1 Tax=Paralimibaculum aggregatum TaxID=3036245 RepID=A0ABQ6LQ77_9RHOB|nr:AraC family transcriptional regulator [Limibaculum sp. NKW23]GMG82776.1 AraC family transcriptional regulator [Limibaculum sp. NKW23]